MKKRRTEQNSTEQNRTVDTNNLVSGLRNLRRKFLHVVLYAFFVLIFSCKDGIEDFNVWPLMNNTSSSNQNLESLTTDVYDDVYQYHYQGLSYARNQFTNFPNLTIKNVLEAFNANNVNYSNIEINWNLIDTILLNRDSIVSYLNNFVNIISDIPEFSSTKKYKAIELIYTMVNTNLGSTYRDSIVVKVNTEMDEEIRQGYALLLSSYDYWTLEIIDNNNDIPMIQLDCAGYIIGWLDAVLDDIADGKLKPEGQWKRIKKGALYGLTTSMGFWK